MRTAQFKKTEREKVDRMLRKELKTTLSVPEPAANEYIYGHRKHGCLEVPLAAEESDLNLIDTAFKLLTSRDDSLRELAIAHFVQTVRLRLGRDSSDDDLGAFISGEIEDDFARTSNKLSNSWTVARSATRRLNVE
ncbi:reverse transcriptase domain-containing protein [Caerostris extrusa]|uniref:Reverse transcriptase domain-containing protein n=1 Tax=Caerostris extrusa TaxID=172846 RepID=A0AAV4X7J0_CAEEX|nr:reverse transcriptase domain-containing protein [Caerostris extrusa]